MDNKVKVVGYSKSVKFTDGIEYRNFSDSLVGQQFTDDGGTTLFTAGNFSITTNLDSKETREYKTRNFSDFITLNTLDNQNIERFKLDNTIKLNYNFDDLSSYAYFGSLKEFVAYSVTDIINRYPASLYIDTLNRIDLVTTGDTIFNLTYNNDLTTTFDINVKNIYNPFGLNYLQNGNITSEINVENDIINLNESFLKYVVDLNDRQYSVIGFSGSTLVNNGFIRLTVDGILENITNLPFHIKPNDRVINRFYKGLNGLQSRLLNRNSTPLNTFNARYKITTDSGVLVNTYRQLTWETIDGYNLDVETINYKKYISDLNEVVEFFDSNTSDIIYRRLMPQAITDFDTLPKDSDFDEDSGEKVTSLIRLYGRSFDDMKIYIDNISNVYSTTYNKINNTPDSLIKTVANMLGFDTPKIVLNNKSQKDDLYGYIDSDYVENEIWRRLLINSNWLFTSKGTRKVIEFIFNLLGIPNELININEYVYKSNNVIDVDKLKLAIDKLKEEGNVVDLSELSIDDNGFPRINRNIPFQSNGGWYQETFGDNSVVDILSGNNPHIGVYDNGTSYYNQFKNLIPNFQPIKIVTNNILNRKVNLYFNYNFGKVNNSTVIGTNNDCYDCDIIEKEVEIVTKNYVDLIDYGYLYNWYVINGINASGDSRTDGGIVNQTQADWVVPSGEQLRNQLPTALGGVAVAGGKLKATGFDFWDSPNTGASNDSGFNAKASGVLSSTGVYAAYKRQLTLWSTTEHTTLGFSNVLYIQHDNNGVVLQNNKRYLGLSIRLCRDKYISESEGDIIQNAYIGNNGVVYSGVVIGGLVWLRENLRETKNNLGEDLLYFDETQVVDFRKQGEDNRSPAYTHYFLGSTTNTVTIKENSCIKCPDGYVYDETQDICIKEDIRDINSDIAIIQVLNNIQETNSNSFTNRGVALYTYNNKLVTSNFSSPSESWFIDDENIPLQVEVISFFTGAGVVSPVSYLFGRMKTYGVKPNVGGNLLINNTYGFTTCLNVELSKKYLIAVSANDKFRVYVNGELIIDNFHNLVNSATISISYGYIHIFELTLNSGTNSIIFEYSTSINSGVQNINYFAEIYNLTIDEFKLITNEGELIENLLFTTKDLNVFDIYPDSIGNSYCNYGYTYDSCRNLCVNISERDKVDVSLVNETIESNISLLDINNKKLLGEFDLCVTKIPTIYPEISNNDCGCDENVDDESLLVTISDLVTKTYTSPYKLLFGTNDVRGTIFTYRLNEIPKINISFDLTLYYNSDELLNDNVFSNLLTVNNNNLTQTLIDYLSNINLSFNLEKIIDNEIDETFSYSLLTINDLITHFETFKENNGVYIGGENIEDFYNNIQDIDTDLLVSKPFKFSLTISDISVLEQLRNNEIKFSIGINSAYTPLNIIINNIDFNLGINKNIEVISVEDNYSFELNKVVDNKKSWTENDEIRINDFENRPTEYNVSNDKLILNSKNVDIEINIIKAVEIFINKFLKDEYNLTYNDLIKVNNRLVTFSYDNLIVLYRIYVGVYNGGQPNLSYNEFTEYINSLNINWLGLVEQFVNSTSIWGNTERFGNSIFNVNKFRYLPYQLGWGDDNKSILKRERILVEFNSITTNPQYNSVGTLFYGLNNSAYNENFVKVSNTVTPLTLKSNNNQWFATDSNNNLVLEYRAFINTNQISDNFNTTNTLIGEVNDIWYNPSITTGRLNVAGVEVDRYSDKMEYFDIEFIADKPFSFSPTNLYSIGVGKSDTDESELMIEINGVPFLNLPKIIGNSGQSDVYSAGATFFSILPIVPIVGKNVITIGHKAKVGGCKFALEIYNIDGTKTYSNTFTEVADESELDEYIIFSTKDLLIDNSPATKEILSNVDISNVDVYVGKDDKFDSIKLLNYNYNNTFKGSFNIK